MEYKRYSVYPPCLDLSLIFDNVFRHQIVAATLQVPLSRLTCIYSTVPIPRTGYDSIIFFSLKRSSAIEGGSSLAASRCELC
jgi:hypothetical protein